MKYQKERKVWKGKRVKASIPWYLIVYQGMESCLICPVGGQNEYACKQTLLEERSLNAVEFFHGLIDQKKIL